MSHLQCTFILLVFMFLKMLLLCEALATTRAMVWPQTIVHPLMSLQILLLCEALVATRAMVGPQTLVHPHVLSQVIGLAERLSTHLTSLLIRSHNDASRKWIYHITSLLQIPLVLLPRIIIDVI